MTEIATLQTLIDSLPNWGARPALGLSGECGAYWYSYLKLHRLARTVAQAFAGRHYPAGTRVVLWANNSPEWVACLLGAALRGLTVVAIDGQSPASSVDDIVVQTRAALVIVGPDQEHERLASAKELIFNLAADEEEPVSIADLKVEVQPSCEAVILFTSGSTGRPRGVVLSHRNLMCQVNSFSYWRSILTFVQVRLLALSPLSHVQGLVVGACLPISLGLSTLYSPFVEPKYLMSVIRFGRIGILLAVPRVLQLLEQSVKQEISRRFNFDAATARKLPVMRALRRILGPRFRAIWVGGATVPRHCEAFWRHAGTLLIQGYGATETAAIATVNNPIRSSNGSIGRPLHNGSVHIAGDGEILVRGPHVCTTYLNDFEKGQHVTEDGFFRTGDLAQRDERERLYFLGRKKEIIVTGEGHNVYPSVIESALAECRGVRDSVVSGRLRDGFEEVHAVLLLEPGYDAHSIVQAANSQLPAGCRIRSWSDWPEDDFPRGALGKVLRTQVIARAAFNHPALPDLNPPSPGLLSLEECLAEPDWGCRLDKLTSYFRATTTGCTNAELVSILKDSGLDSIAVIQLLLKLQDRTAASTNAKQEFGAKLPGEPDDREIHLRPDREKPPAWQFWPGTHSLRYVVRLLTLDLMIPVRSRIEVRGVQNLADLRSPFLVALASADRQHPKDYLAVYKALPRRLGRRAAFGMRSNPPDGFAPYLHPDGSAGRLRRAGLAVLFHVGVPLWFPFTLFPGSTIESTMSGMKLTAQALDRGYHPVIVWGRGSALIATETRASVVPVRLSGNESLKQLTAGRSHVHVSFGSPFHVGPGMKAPDVFAGVEEALKKLKSAGGQR